MRILFIPGGSIGKGSASLTHVKGIIYNFPNRHDIIVISPKEWDLNSNNNIKIISLSNYWMSIPTLFGKIRAITLLIIVGCFFAWKEKPGLIYARDGVGSTAAFFVSLITGIPMVVEVNGIVHDRGEIEVWLGRKNLLVLFLSKTLKYLEKKIYNRAKFLFICTSGNFAMHIKNIYNISHSKMVSISNGTDPKIFKPIEPLVARKYLCLDTDLKYIVFIGSFAPWHGLDQLVGCAPLVIATYPNARFLVVGDGPQKPHIVNKLKEKCIENYFIFTGRIPHTEAPYYINAGDVCLLIDKATMEYGSMGISPLKLFEYMACGRPVIATNLPGLNKYISGTGSGLLVEPDNVEEIARAIITLLSDANLCLKMGNLGRAAVLNKYNWQSIASFTANVCENLVTTPGN